MTWVIVVAVVCAASIGYVLASIVIVGRQAVAPLAPTPEEFDASKNAEEHRAIARQEAQADVEKITHETNEQKLSRLNALLRARR